MNNVNKLSQKAGLPPGSLIHVGDIRSGKVKIRILDYSADFVNEFEFDNINEALKCPSNGQVHWIEVAGIHRVEVIEKLGTAYGIHPLILEDILNTRQTPKIDLQPEYVFIAAKNLAYSSDSDWISGQQVSLIVGENYIISFLETDEDCFRTIKERLRNPKSKIRSLPADYLAYAILDCIVDHYYVVLENLGERIEQIENSIMKESDPTVLHAINRIKREMLIIRKAVWPLREVMNSIGRGDSQLFQANTLVYIRDVYDHTIQIIDTIEMYRDTVSGMLDIYLSSVSNKLSEVMKILTIISTFFIPLTFIVGVYGMNFKMPELEMEHGYAGVWIVMISIGLMMFRYFRRKKWL